MKSHSIVAVFAGVLLALVLAPLAKKAMGTKGVIR